MALKYAIFFMGFTLLRLVQTAGSEVDNANGGNGNVLDDSYCDYAGNDCSATCCIQQTCATTLAECEYGYNPDESHIAYFLVGILASTVGLPLLTAVLFKLCTLRIWSVPQGEEGEDNKSVKVLRVSDIICKYVCCILICCYRRPKIVTEDTLENQSLNTCKYRSKFMVDIEQEGFDFEERLDTEYLKPLKSFHASNQGSLNLAASILDQSKFISEEAEINFNPADVDDEENEYGFRIEDTTKRDILNADDVSDVSSDVKHQLSMLNDTKENALSTFKMARKSEGGDLVKKSKSNALGNNKNNKKNRYGKNQKTKIEAVMDNDTANDEIMDETAYHASTLKADEASRISHGSSLPPIKNGSNGSAKARNSQRTVVPNTEEQDEKGKYDTVNY